MKTVVGLVLFLSSAAALAQAPFCAVTGLGSQCFYYSLNACQQAVRGMDGMCVANAQQSQQPQIQPTPQRRPYDINGALVQPDFVGSAIRAGEAGARARRDREEHEAMMRLIEAQTQEQVSITQRMNETGKHSVVYRCPNEDGSVRFSSVPAVGCVVIAIADH
jgi:hypothetical protein